MDKVILKFLKYKLPDIEFPSMAACARWVKDHKLPSFATQNMTDAMTRKKKRGKPQTVYMPAHGEYMLIKVDREEE